MAPPRRYRRQPYEVGVYGILNRITGKWYVGSSIELSKRMGRHLWELRTGRHHSQKLQRSFDKHGETAFEFKVLLTCVEADVHLFEQRAINVLKSASHGYNVAAEPKGGFMRGRKWPEGTKAARVEAMKGFTHTEASRQRIKDALAARTDEEKALQAQRSSEARRGQKKTPQAAANIAAASLKRAKDPLLAEARRQNLLKGWETRRLKASQQQTVTQAEVTLG